MNLFKQPDTAESLPMGPENDISQRRLVSTPYLPAVSKTIKDNIRKAWERAQSNRGLTQSELARALGMTQGAVSKLLAADNSHPWTIGKIKLFADFCRISVSEILGNLDETQSGFFNNWGNDVKEPPAALVDECMEAVDRFYVNFGKSLPRERLAQLAVKVAAKVMRTGKHKEDFEVAIRHVVLEEASRLA